MPGVKRYRLGDLQLKIMKVLWDRAPATVAEVHEVIDGDLAYTTIATMLRKMELRGLVKHKEKGRRFVYSAAVKPDAVSQSMADDVLDRVFEGSLADMMSHLLATREISREELKQLERLIAERRKQS